MTALQLDGFLGCSAVASLSVHAPAFLHAVSKVQCPAACSAWSARLQYTPCIGGRSGNLLAPWRRMLSRQGTHYLSYLAVFGCHDCYF